MPLSANVLPHENMYTQLLEAIIQGPPTTVPNYATQNTQRVVCNNISNYTTVLPFARNSTYSSQSKKQKGSFRKPLRVNKMNIPKDILPNPEVSKLLGKK